jgi:hypothetical protein
MRTLGRLRMKIKKASKDLIEGESMFPCLKTSYMEENTQKDEKTEN